MAAALLPSLPSGSRVFIDANVFVYGLSGRSAQCRQFLDRCSAQDVTGISLIEVVNEATHQFMMAEALEKGLLAKRTVETLRRQYDLVRRLHRYWTETERLLEMNLILFAANERMIRRAQAERQAAGLLTNDSIIVACMREYAIGNLATSDQDFERVSGIGLYVPDDI